MATSKIIFATHVREFLKENVSAGEDDTYACVFRFIAPTLSGPTISSAEFKIKTSSETPANPGNEDLKSVVVDWGSWDSSTVWSVFDSNLPSDSTDWTSSLIPQQPDVIHAWNLEGSSGAGANKFSDIIYDVDAPGAFSIGITFTGADWGDSNGSDGIRFTQDDEETAIDFLALGSAYVPQIEFVFTETQMPKGSRSTASKMLLP